MKTYLHIHICIAAIFICIFTSCNKEKIAAPINNVVNVIETSTVYAGKDQTILLPVDSVYLEGSTSNTQAADIKSWLWQKISGPGGYIIVTPDEKSTWVKNLPPGKLDFQLSVTTVAGNILRDTVSILVVPQTNPLECSISDRPIVPAQLELKGHLSLARIGMSVVAADGKIFFAGATIAATNQPPYFNEYGSKVVDIFDINSQQWSVANLSKSRSNIASVSAGSKVFFAGGRLGDGAFDELFSTVDIYDMTTKTWSVSQLSQPRAFIGAASVGNKVFFAGGETDWDYQTSDVVDVYNIQTNQWQVHTLGEARAYISPVTFENKIFFAGGHKEDRWYANPSNRVDVYDSDHDSWNKNSLLNAGGSFGSIATSGQVLWTNGCIVEIRNPGTWEYQLQSLSSEASWSVNDGHQVVQKDNKLVFLRFDYWNGSDRFDIYDLDSKTWKVGLLPKKIYGPSVIAINNEIYLAGGTINGYLNQLSNNVYLLKF